MLMGSQMTPVPSQLMLDGCPWVEHVVVKNTNTQLKYSLYWLLLGLVDLSVQHE